MNPAELEHTDPARSHARDILQKVAGLLPGVVYQFRLHPDGSTSVPYASEAALKIYRLDPEEVREDASKAFSSVHPDDLDDHLASIRASAQDLTPWQQEYRLKFDDGTVRWLYGSALPQREADGSTLWHGFITDISERKITEKRLVQSEAFLQTIINSSPECIKVVSEEGYLRQINPAGLAMIEADTLEQASMHPVLKIIAPEYREAYARLHERVLAGEHMQMEFEVVGLKGGRRWLKTHAVPIQDGDRMAHLAITSDITGRKQAEAAERAALEIRASHEAVRRLAAHVERSRDEERKGIAQMVHDELGQVLSVLRMDIALLKDRVGMGNAEMDGIERDMLARVDRAIQGVRNIARSLRPALLDMGGYLPAIEWQCAEFAKRNGIPCALEAIGDSADLNEDQALVAIRTVQESLANITRHADATRAEVSIAAEEGRIELKVRDDGKGFDPDEASGSGTFGLLGMHERAISIGGELNIASRPGQGTTVTLHIPYALKHQ